MSLLIDFSTSCTDEDSANLFNSYFYSVFMNSSFKLPNIHDLPSPISQLAGINITEEEMYTTLVEIDPNKSMGPDEIGPNYSNITL